MSSPHETQEISHHIVPVRIYIIIFSALMLLTGTTVLVAYVDLGAYNLAAALGIAILKATLVILFFMHVKYGDHLVKVFVAAGFLFLLVMISITFADYLTRGWITLPRGWQHLG